MTSDRYRRPAEAQLPQTFESLRVDLLDGFESREAVLLWLQELAISTLGQVATPRYADFAHEFRPDTNANEGVVLASFLNSKARTRDLADDVARSARRQWWANVIVPVQSNSMRALRKDAGEYVGKMQDDTPDHDEAGERIDNETRHQRPALEELHTFQQKTLQRLLGDALDDREAILDWGEDLVLATRGEPITDGRSPGELIRDLHNDPSGDRIMCSTQPAWVRHRQTWICRQILPAFNRAVQDLTKRTAEEPTETKDTSKATTPGWGDN